MPKGYTEDFKHLPENKLTWFSEIIYQGLQRVFLRLPCFLLKCAFNTCINSLGLGQGASLLPSLAAVSGGGSLSGRCDFPAAGRAWGHPLFFTRCLVAWTQLVCGSPAPTSSHPTWLPRGALNSPEREQLLGGWRLELPGHHLRTWQNRPSVPSPPGGGWRGALHVFPLPLSSGASAVKWWPAGTELPVTGGDQAVP